MSTDVTIFGFNNNDVRVLTDNQGEPWFVLADICKVLDLTNPTMVASRLDSDGLSTAEVIDSMGRTQKASTVSEAGLYEAIFMSRKEEARAFRRWVTHEVLPAIRKHGGYLTDAKIAEALTDPDTIIRLATDLKAERARRAQLEAQATADAPKVIFADAVSASHTSILVGELAKILRGNGIKIGQNRLYEWLRTRGYLIQRKGTDYNMPTQRSMELALFEIKETAISHSDGHVTISKTPKVTGKGQAYFVNKFLADPEDVA